MTTLESTSRGCPSISLLGSCVRPMEPPSYKPVFTSYANACVTPNTVTSSPRRSLVAAAPPCLSFPSTGLHHVPSEVRCFHQAWCPMLKCSVSISFAPTMFILVLSIHPNSISTLNLHEYYKVLFLSLRNTSELTLVSFQHPIPPQPQPPPST
ncbi:hypothetical protein BDM02DRAFT_1981729 [Thelephora ganbajun]|uniref:Uncharacterized protein n=1 Tax=Thelephora ganbajun TaxID=370292 RepID=A0ACB6ZH15_THEGA|nr:hypothetical protein BDM02DRAFT_1981729 [Thelephora ganbajun]